MEPSAVMHGPRFFTLTFTYYRIYWTHSNATAAQYNTHMPINRPSLVGSELHYINDVVVQDHTAGNGVYNQRRHALLQAALDVPKALLTTSCTHALEMAALLLNIHSGDEVIVPSFTFISTSASPRQNYIHKRP